MYNSEAAEQVVRISIQGSEVALKLTGTAAKHLAVLIYSILKDQKMTAGKARLISMIKTGKELKVFTFPASDLKTFATEAKRYGVLYCVLKEKDAVNGMVDVLVKEEDASKIDRIIEKLKLVNVEVTGVVHDIEKSREDQSQAEPDIGVQEKSAAEKEEEREAEKPAGKESPEPENPTTAKPEKSPRSEPISESKETSRRDISDTSRKSVRKTMEEIKEERSKGKSRKGKNREKPLGAVRNDELLQQHKSQADRERRYR
jgi:hypothetical protein